MAKTFSEVTLAVVEGEPERVSDLLHAALAQGKDPLVLFDELIMGIREVGDRFGRGEYFLPDLMLGAKAMTAGNLILQGKLSATTTAGKNKRGKVLLGTVKGDLHDIGKSLVGLMLEVNDYEVRDLGVDVPEDVFIAQAKEYQPDVIGLSSLLTNTALHQRTVVQQMEEAGLRDRCCIIVGGAATSENWAHEIGADGWAENASDAVILVENLLSRRGGAGGGKA